MGGNEQPLMERTAAGLITFRESERLLKRGMWIRKFPPKVMRVHKWFNRYLKSGSFYVLCDSAYTREDLEGFAFSRRYCYKHGYFPTTKFGIPRGPFKSKVKVLWAARFIDWKQPYIPIRVVAKLRRLGFDVELIMAGDGPLLEKSKKLTSELGAEEYIEFIGSVDRSSILNRMIEADIFLGTSNMKEGWGTAINEAMAAGCIVLGNVHMGSVPYLIQDGYNGFIWDGEDENSLVCLLKTIIENTNVYKVSSAAIQTIDKEWNGYEAAKRIIRLTQSIENGIYYPFSKGLCSQA